MFFTNKEYIYDELNKFSRIEEIMEYLDDKFVASRLHVNKKLNLSKICIPSNDNIKFNDSLWYRLSSSSNRCIIINKLVEYNVSFILYNAHSYISYKDGVINIFKEKNANELTDFFVDDNSYLKYNLMEII